MPGFIILGDVMKGKNSFIDYRHSGWDKFIKEQVYPYIEEKTSDLTREDIKLFVESIARAALGGIIAEVQKSGVKNEWVLDKDGNGCLVTSLPGIPFKFTVVYDADSFIAFLERGIKLAYQVYGWEYDKAQREGLRAGNLQNQLRQSSNKN